MTESHDARLLELAEDLGGDRDRDLFREHHHDPRAGPMIDPHDAKGLAKLPLVGRVRCPTVITSDPVL